MKKHRLSTLQAIAVAALITAAATIWVWRVTSDATTAIFMICPGVAFAALLLLGSDSVLERLGNWIQGKPARIAVIPASLWLLYVVYSIGMGIAGTEKVI